MTRIQDLATEARSYFERAQRTDDSTYWHTRADRPEWVQDMTHAAHDAGRILPDDYRYAFIVDALDALANNKDVDDARTESEEPDIYTAALAAWLGSRADRYTYCDEAVGEIGGGVRGIIQAMELGQAREKGEVFQAVLDALTARVVETEPEEVE